jgi:hypothetical protein
VSGNSDDSLDLEELKAQVRARAARRRAEVAAVIPLAARAPSQGGWTFNWLEAKGQVRTAERFVQAGTPPLLENAHGLKRRLGMLVGRIVMRLTRFITTRQTDYNRNVLDLVRDMAEALHDVEGRVIGQQEQIRQLESCLAQVQLRAGVPPAERKAS